MTIDKNHKYYDNFVDYCMDIAEQDQDCITEQDIMEEFNILVNDEYEFRSYIEDKQEFEEIEI